jgi:thioredoxin reductase
MPQTNGQSKDVADVAIVGAGPYGLSIAAHLASAGIRFRIFGPPMNVWQQHMPKGMRLKSEGFASSLSDPESGFTLQHYCEQKGIAYSDVGKPVRLATFIDYGMAFQKKFVPNLEDKFVESVQESPVGYELQLEDGEKVLARRVVIAVGITYYSYLPPVLGSLPKEVVSHSSAHSDLGGFAGRSVAVVGAGASALDLAAFLQEAGASVQLIARSSTIRFQLPPDGSRSPEPRFLDFKTGIGSGAELYFCVNAPQLFRHLPESLRLDRVRKLLGPAPPWFTKEQIQGKVPFHLGVEITAAEVRNDHPTLLLKNEAGQQSTVEADHVIAATGYQVDIEKLQLLSPNIRKKIRTTGRAPALSASFESSVPSLYFVGVSSANTFGPLMRFAYGSDYTARRLSKHLVSRFRN